MSKYAESTGGNSWSGGSAIIPLTMDEAMDWAESNLSADEYEVEFGEVSDGPAVVTSVSLPPAIAAKLARMSSTQGRSRSEIVAELIDRAGE